MDKDLKHLMTHQDNIKDIKVGDMFKDKEDGELIIVTKIFGETIYIYGITPPENQFYGDDRVIRWREHSPDWLVEEWTKI